MGSEMCIRDRDRWGDHAVICGKGGDRTSRHDQIGRLIGAALATSGHPPTYEDPLIVPTLSRPADVSTPAWLDGRPAAFDVCVSSPVAASHLAQAAHVAGHTAAEAERRKCAKSEAMCREVGVTFWPLSFETFGTPGPRVEKLIRLVGQRQASRLGTPRSETTARLRQRLSVGVARGSANMILRRLAPFLEADRQR